MKKGDELHEKKLQEYVEQARLEGRKVIDLEAKSPDAIEVIVDKNCIKVVAIEVLPHTTHPTRKGHHGWTHKQKQNTYKMFDEVRIIEY